jgi:hypothetical protein
VLKEMYTIILKTTREFKRKNERDILNEKTSQLFLTHTKFTETPHNACPAARLEAPGCKPTTQGLSPTPAATQNAR